MIDRALVRSAAVLAVIGAVVGVATALVTHLLVRHQLDHTAAIVYHGKYVPMQGIPVSTAYSSALTVRTDPDPSLWPLLGWCVAGGVVLALVIVAALRLTGRRISLVRTDRTDRTFSAASPSG